MVKIVKLEQADDGKHKWVAHFEDGRRTKFGSLGAVDFTITKDKEQRERYRDRHRKDLETNDPHRAGHLSWFILWNLPTITASVRDFNKRFG
jgi:hypothetical protein